MTMTANEEWRPVPGYEGLYEVSSHGRVKSHHIHGHREEKILSPGNVGGYLNVVLCRDKNKKYVGVHRLVAMAFIDNPNNYRLINHKDENPSNNHVENLEWCTNEYNLNYGFAIKRRSISKSKPIMQISMSGEFLKMWTSGEEAKRCGYSKGDICMCCRGKMPSYRGFIWRYA